MSLHLDAHKLQELMMSFHTLTGFRMALFDCDYREILTYPKEHCSFCAMMHACAESEKRCDESNRRSFVSSKRQGALVLYCCHAGLIEATVPIITNGVIIGYIMIGQITDNPDKSSLLEQLENRLSACGLSGWNQKLPLYKTEDEIAAAAQLLEACTSYLILKEIVGQEKQQFIFKLKQYVDLHIQEAICPESIARDMGISRSRLYLLGEQHLGAGIAHYIREMRLQKAQDLLKQTSIPVSRIAQQVGFSDYNYFSRVFKAYYGVSATQYRKNCM